MDFSFSPDQQEIRDAVLKICTQFPDEYWLFNAGSKYDRSEECGLEANSAKYLAAEAGFESCQAAMMSMGTIGYKGGMLDRPYLSRAETLLRQAGKL